MRAAILLIVLMTASLCRAADSDESWKVRVLLGNDGWMLYENPRFGFALPVPPAMKAERPPDNGGGQIFISADGMRLAAWAHFNTDGAASVEAEWKNELAVKNRTITYKRKTDGWYVVSGVNQDGTGFYTKYFADAQYFAYFSILYPQADEKKYQPVIERIAKDFQPRLGKGADRTSEDSERPAPKK